MNMKLILLAACAAPLSSCAQWLDPPQSIGDINAGYRYVAIEPLPVAFSNNFSGCPVQPGTTPGLMNALPDLASRVSTEDVTGEASGSVPGVAVGGSGRSYRVTQDFIAYDTARLRFEIPPELLEGSGSTRAPAPSQLAAIRVLAPGQERAQNSRNRVVTVPVYVGVGLRLTANLRILSGKVSLSGLGPLSAAVSANRARGDLAAQSLGLGGTRVRTILPQPGELNATTIQAAAVAMGQIKAILDEPTTQHWPRVVGIHYPFARVNPAVVNAIVGTLVDQPIRWTPCATDGAGLRVG